MPKTRIDVLMVERSLAETREKAQALIMAGEVSVGGRPATKAGQQVDAGADISVRAPLPFVSRGGFKLQHALDRFGLDVAGLVVADVGASTGGFTDCLLQRGAARVYAIDVGKGQLDWRLRQDPRVVVLDETNVRYLETLPEPMDAAVVDVSFISLRLVLPVVARLLRPAGWIVALVKPQFEAGRGKVGKGGVVRDRAVHREVLESILGWATENGLGPVAAVASPIRGPAGNVEFLVQLQLGAAGKPVEDLVEVSLASVPGDVQAESALRKKVLLVQNPRVRAAAAVVHRLNEIATQSGACVVLGSTTDEAGIRDGLRDADVVVTVGGDGTILRVARLALPAGTPILGVNMGELGFLAELSPVDAESRLPALLAGEGWVEERVGMCVSLDGAQDPGDSLIAINDVQIGRGELSRVVKVTVWIDGARFTTYLGDGLLVATPTGSTAYSLAAGGSVLDPRLSSMILTPIVPYLSFPYPLVLAPASTVRLVVSTDYAAALTIDGQVDVPLKSGDSVTVKAASQPCRFLRCESPGRFYQTLTRRLRPDHFWEEGDRGSC